MKKYSREFARWHRKIKRYLDIMKADYRTYFGGSLIFIFLFTGLFAPLLAPHHPYETDVTRRLETPSREHLAGTDELGRDIFSRIIYAFRISIMVAFGGVLISVTGGIILGTMAAYFGGFVDNTLLLIFDIIRAFPPIILILSLVSVVGPSLRNIIVILGVTIMPRYGRVIRAETLSVKEEDYVTAARTIGAGTPRILFKEILPNVFPSVLVLAGMDMASMIMWEAGLSFLGFGVQPPATSWGLMLRQGYDFIQILPHMILFPAFCISLTMLGFSTFSESLRKAFNPRTSSPVEAETDEGMA